ncbi:MAG: PhzF family phenazine biosynthesis protein [Gallionella sp.]|nr:PhzF family phenazine biosynthesis protein [Gallionella sp.]
MKIKQYQIDAFTTQIFGGNPAAVCSLNAWLGDDLLQAIAAENNLSETAFFVPTENGFHLRWFTPIAEVNLCGHATLATAYVLFEILGYAQASIAFETRSGILNVTRSGLMLVMDFPAAQSKSCAPAAALLAGLGVQAVEVFAADDYFVVVDSEEIVRAIQPDFAKLAELDLRGVCVTARGRNVDFVSRFFAPKFGIPEDPVTGSTHCALTPYWAKSLNKSILSARQLSKRGGDIQCELKGERVTLAGYAVTFMEADVFLPS